jgi:hypothetical protein
MRRRGGGKRQWIGGDTEEEEEEERRRRAGAYGVKGDVHWLSASRPHLGSPVFRVLGSTCGEHATVPRSRVAHARIPAPAGTHAGARMH